MRDKALPVIDQVIEMITQLVWHDTTPDKPTLPILQFIAHYFSEYGVDYTIVPTKKKGHGVLLGRLGPAVSGGILFSGHLDVVTTDGQDWAHNPFELTKDKDRLYGRGVCDMKGFIGCVLSMIPTWAHENLSKPIYFGFTTDEESEVTTIADLVKIIDPEIKPAIAIVGEPTNMQIIDSHKGVQDLCIHIKGVPAHSSRPDLGVNAIDIAHDLMSFCKKRADTLKATAAADHFNPPYPTLGIMKMAGGNSSNIIPEQASLYWHLRHVMNQQALEDKTILAGHIQQVVQPHYPTAQFNISDELFMPALERREKNDARDMLQKIISTKVTTAPFCTEAGYYQSAGIDVVVCGPGSIEQAHKANESIEISQIQLCLDLLRKIPATLTSLPTSR